MIADAKIIDESKLKTDSVQILNRVELKNMKNGMKMTYTIVSESEANLKEGKISVNTPIAQGLLGKKVGDIAEYCCHNLNMIYKIRQALCRDLPLC